MLRAAGFFEVHAIRPFAGHGPLETMNYRHTHAPAGWRAQWYRWFVIRLAARACRRVQAWGAWGDVLVAVARCR